MKFGFRAWRLTASLALGACLPETLAAASAPTRNAASKIYVTEVSGDATIRVNGRIEPLKAKTAYPADQIALMTKDGSSATIVLSNGTALTLETGTNIEIKRFVQEPFEASRNDFDLEPSTSDVRLEVTAGTVSIVTSRLRSYSSLLVETPQLDVQVHSGRVVIAVTDLATTTSILDGSCTVRGNDVSAIDRTVKMGEVATATTNTRGQAQVSVIEVTKIPTQKMAALDDQVSVAAMARKTVYFEVKEMPIETTLASGSGQKVEPPANAVNAFTGEAATAPTIVPRAVVPVELPVQFTVSPARIK